VTRVAGIVLAAGASRRLGRPKQLLDWEGEPLVRRVVRRVLGFGLAPVVVVLGHAADAVRAAVAGLPVSLVVNPAPDRGQATSVACGLAGLPADVGAALVFLADQPTVPPSAVAAVLAALTEAEPGTVAVAPFYRGVRANPVGFPRPAWPELAELTGDGGVRLFLDAQVARVRLVPIDADVPFDVDAPEDLAAEATPRPTLRPTLHK